LDVIWKNKEITEGEDPLPTWSYNVTNVTDNQITVKIAFDDPLMISQGSKPDLLEIRFDNRYFYRRQTDGEPLDFNSLILY